MGRAVPVPPALSVPRGPHSAAWWGWGDCICFLDKSSSLRFKPGTSGDSHARGDTELFFCFSSDTISTCSHVLDPQSYSHGNRFPAKRDIWVLSHRFGSSRRPCRERRKSFTRRRGRWVLFIRFLEAISQLMADVSSKQVEHRCALPARAQGKAPPSSAQPRGVRTGCWAHRKLLPPAASGAGNLMAWACPRWLCASPGESRGLPDFPADLVRPQFPL